METVLVQLERPHVPLNSLRNSNNNSSFVNIYFDLLF